MTEFVGLRSKLYSYTGEESGKRAKGVNRAVRKKKISHYDYLECLREQRVFQHEMPGLCSHAHRIFGETVCKTALSRLDTKRYITADGVHTLAFGHRYIPSQDSESVAGELIDFLNTTPLPHLKMNFD